MRRAAEDTVPVLKQTGKVGMGGWVILGMNRSGGRREWCIRQDREGGYLYQLNAFSALVVEEDTLDGEEPLLLFVALSAELHWADSIVLSSSSSSSLSPHSPSSPFFLTASIFPSARRGARGNIRV
jgi:hypothetical protein